MFETITEKRIRYLSVIADNLQGLTHEDIGNSSFPAFNKKFILEEAKEIKDRKHLDLLIDKSVKLNINYAIRPKWTLLNYLYGGFDSKASEEILRRADIFQYYKFYTEFIVNYIKSNSMIFLTSAKVEELIDDTNNVLYEKLTTDITGIKVRNFFVQIFKLKYGEEKDINLEDSIPFVFVRLFLEDKKFYDLLEKFKVVEGIKDTDEMELKVIIKVLLNKYEMNSEYIVDVKPEETYRRENIVIEKEDIEKVRDDKVFRKIKIDNGSEVGENITGEKIREVKPEETIKEIKAEIFGGGMFEDHLPGPGSRKIKRMFKEGELNVIAKKVFKSSRLSMFSAFEEMEKFNTWGEAIVYLKEIFKKNNVDKYNKTVILFIDLLNDYYTNIEKGYL